MGDPQSDFLTEAVLNEIKQRYPTARWIAKDVDMSVWTFDGKPEWSETEETWEILSTEGSSKVYVRSVEVDTITDAFHDVKPEDSLVRIRY